MNKKGFTLTELIATIVILGVLMTVAIPNVLSIIERNKALNMVEDAKKLITEVEYEIKRDTTIELPSNGKRTIISLSYLRQKGSTNLEESPYGIRYNDSSYVSISNTENIYTYSVTLTAIDTKSDNSIKPNSRGIKSKTLESLNNSNNDNLVEKASNFTSNDLILPSGSSIEHLY